MVSRNGNTPSSNNVRSERADVDLEIDCYAKCYVCIANWGGRLLDLLNLQNSLEQYTLMINFVKGKIYTLSTNFVCLLTNPKKTRTWKAF